MGKLVVIEGLDGSGKSTQLELLPQNLAQKGVNCQTVSFPDYADPSSTLVKMYLAGEFGQNVGDVNAHAATLFYTVDRYASFRRHWQKAYEDGGLIIAPTHAVPFDVPAENILAMAEVFMNQDRFLAE